MRVFVFDRAAETIDLGSKSRPASMWPRSAKSDRFAHRVGCDGRTAGAGAKERGVWLTTSGLDRNIQSSRC